MWIWTMFIALEMERRAQTYQVFPGIVCFLMQHILPGSPSFLSSLKNKELTFNAMYPTNP